MLQQSSGEIAEPVPVLRDRRFEHAERDPALGTLISHQKYQCHPPRCGRTTEMATKRDGRESILEAKTKLGRILYLYPRLELWQVKEVTAIHWQVLDLLFTQDACTVGCFVFTRVAVSGASIVVVSEPTCKVTFTVTVLPTSTVAETFAGPNSAAVNWVRVVTGNQGSRIERAGGVCRDSDDSACRCICDAHRGADDHRPGRIADGTHDAVGTDGDLSEQ